MRSARLCRAERSQSITDPINSHGDEGGVLDLDLHLFGGRDQMIAVWIEPQHGGKKPYQGFTTDGCALVKPQTITLNDNVDLAAMGRIPQVNRRQAALACLRRCDDAVQSACQCRGHGLAILISSIVR